MTALVLTPPPPRQLVHFTPLRYPGGKGKLAAYVKVLIKCNKLLDGEYVEPYPGGAAIAFELLFHEYVSRVHINDISRPVFAFWNSVLNNPEELCKRVRNTELTVSSRVKQKTIFANQNDFGEIDVGFAAFFLNRVNRSGILNGGVIGGREQTGPWKIDARFNKDELIYRIESIAKMRNRIQLSHLDALDFLKINCAQWPSKTLIYLGPPYYEKGRDLYYDFYRHEDHEEVRRFVAENLVDKFWIVSYDDANPIRELYKGYRRRSYKIGYSARESREGTEIMFFGDRLQIGPLVGPVRLIGGSYMSGDDDQFSDKEIAQRMERGLRRALSTPPQPHGKNPKSPPPPKPKERPASKGRVHKGKARS
jgi:DNA adenine methylase